MDKIKLAYWATLVGYFGLFFSLLLWVGWLNVEPKLPRSLMLLLTIGPLMFPLRGLLHAKAFTFGWSTFLALFYFTLGVVNVAATDTRLIGAFEIIFSLLFFIGAMLFARWEGMQNKQGEMK